MGAAQSRQEEPCFGGAVQFLFTGQSTSSSAAAGRRHARLEEDEPEVRQAKEKEPVADEGDREKTSLRRAIRHEQEMVARDDRLNLVANTERTQACVSGIKLAEEKLRKRREYSLAKADEAQREALRLGKDRSRRDMALSALKRKAAFEVSAKRANAFADQLMLLHVHIEDALFNAEMIIPLKNAAATLGLSQKNLDVEKIDELMTVIQKQIEESLEMTTRISDPNALGGVRGADGLQVNDDDLSRELDALLQQDSQGAAVIASAAPEREIPVPLPPQMPVTAEGELDWSKVPRELIMAALPPRTLPPPPVVQPRYAIPNQ